MTMPTTPNGNTKTALLASANGASTAGRPATALPVDPATLTDEQLAALAIAVPNEIAARKAKREADFFALVEEQARALNIPPSRLLATLRAKTTVSEGKAADGSNVGGRAVVVDQYRHPENPELRWTGRGLPPPWIELGEERSRRGTRLPLRKFWISEQEKGK